MFLGRCCWKDRPIRPSRRLNEVNDPSVQYLLQCLVSLTHQDLYIADIARLWRNALKAVQYLEAETTVKRLMQT